MSRAGLLKTRRGVEGGNMVVLLTRRMSLILQRSSGSLVTIDSRFDTTTVEAEGCLHEEKSIWHESYEVKRIYFMGIMHNRHTNG